MKTTEERLQSLERLALELNEAMPTDVMLKGDGSIWITEHGNGRSTPRKIDQFAVLRLLHQARDFGNRMSSV